MCVRIDPLIIFIWHQQIANYQQIRLDHRHQCCCRCLCTLILHFCRFRVPGHCVCTLKLSACRGMRGNWNSNDAKLEYLFVVQSCVWWEPTLRHDVWAGNANSISVERREKYAHVNYEMNKWFPSAAAIIIVVIGENFFTIVSDRDENWNSSFCFIWPEGGGARGRERISIKTIQTVCGESWEQTKEGSESWKREELAISACRPIIDIKYSFIDLSPHNSSRQCMQHIRIYSPVRWLLLPAFYASLRSWIFFVGSVQWFNKLQVGSLLSCCTEWSRLWHQV